MYKFLTKNGQTIAFAIGSLIVVAFYALVVSDGNYDTFSSMDLDGVKDKKRFDFGLFDFGLIVTVILIAVGFVLMVAFGLFQAVTDIKGSLGGIIGLVVLVIIFAVAYSTAQLETSGPVYDSALKFELDESTRKIIGGSITTGLILTAIATLGIVLSEIRNFFK